MNTIKILTDENFQLQSIPFENPRIRYGARGILLKDDDTIAVFHKTNCNEYKLPGGGIDDGETPEDAFKRECLEETGCEIEIIARLGIIEEHKSLDNFKQISYIFVSKVINDTKKLALTQKEKDEGSKLEWMQKDFALQKITDCENVLIGSKFEDIYHIKFIVRRDQEILKYYLKERSK